MKKFILPVLFFLLLPSLTQASCDPNNGSDGQSACSPRCGGDLVCGFIGARWQCIPGAKCSGNSDCAAGRVCSGGSCKYSCPSDVPPPPPPSDGGGGGCGNIASSGCSTCPSSGYFYQGGNIQSCFVAGYNKSTPGSCLTGAQCSNLGNSCLLMTQGYCRCSASGSDTPTGQSCCQPANSTYFISKSSANKLAGCLGGSVEESQLGGPYRFIDVDSGAELGGDGNSSTGSVYLINFTCSNGKTAKGFGAGLLADRYQKYSKSVADRMTYDEIIAACASGGKYCGNGACDSGETSSSCPADCKNNQPPPPVPPPGGFNTIQNYIRSMLSILNDILNTARQTRNFLGN